MNKKGLTLLEILVAMIILATVVTGLASTFVSSRKLLMHSRNRITAAQAAKYYLDPLQAQVSQRTWAGNCLGGNMTNCPSAPILESNTNTNYTPSWDITNQSDLSSIRKVKLTLNWTERSAE